MNKYEQAVNDWVVRGESDDYPTRFEKEPLKCRNCGKSVRWVKYGEGNWGYAEFLGDKHVCLTATVKFWKLPKNIKKALLK